MRVGYLVFIDCDLFVDFICCVVLLGLVVLVLCSDVVLVCPFCVLFVLIAI